MIADAEGVRTAWMIVSWMVVPKAQMRIVTVRSVQDGSSLIISSVTDDEARTTNCAADDGRSAAAAEPALARCTRSAACASI